MKENIAKLYKSGCSLQEVSDEFFLSKSRVRKELLRMKIELRPKGNFGATHVRPRFGKMSSEPFYGFCYFEGKIVKEPHEYPTLKKIYKLWKQKISSHHIMTKLNQAKIPTRMRKAWSWAGVQNIIARFETKKIIETKGGQLELR